MCGLLTFVPTIGPTAATLLPLAVSLLVSPAKVLQVLVLRLVLQNGEAFLLTPMLLSRTVNLLPTVALMSQLCLGALLGLPGILLAVAVFCLQGFLATFEPMTEPATFMVFRAAYAICGATSVLAAFVLVLRRVRGGSAS